MRFWYCMNFKNSLLYIRAIQGHTGGNLIALELMGHVAVPSKWKEFLCYRGCSSCVTSIFKSGLIAVGRESKEGRQTLFFTLLNPFWDSPFGGDLTEKSTLSQQVKNTQNAVYWVNFARTQDKGVRFWQTRSDAVIVYNSVPADCIYKMIFKKENELYLEDSRRFVPHRRLYFKSAWQSQQRQQQQQQDTSESASSSTRKLVQ